MANTFNNLQNFVVVECCNCGVSFGMTAAFEKRRREDHQWFYCPAGHQQYYSGKTEAQKLREELERKDAQLGRLEGHVSKARHERDAIAKSHRKMRARIANGVCPCCNRSFDNLRRHMESQHADFGKPQTVRALREAFGLTQAQVASEAGVRQSSYVSMYENGKPVPVEARDALDWWLTSQSA